MASIDARAHSRLIRSSARASRPSIEIGVTPSPRRTSSERLFGQLQHPRTAFGSGCEVFPGGVPRQRTPALDGRGGQVERLTGGPLVGRGHFLVIRLCPVYGEFLELGARRQQNALLRLGE